MCTCFEPTVSSSRKREDPKSTTCYLRWTEEVTAKAEDRDERPQGQRRGLEAQPEQFDDRLTAQNHKASSSKTDRPVRQGCELSADLQDPPAHGQPELDDVGRHDDGDGQREEGKGNAHRQEFGPDAHVDGWS